LLAGLAWILLAVLLSGAGFLLEAHREIRSVTPVLPARDELAAALDVPGGPVAIHYLNTATQRGGPGPTPIGHPAFLLEWADGRSFLIDVGMDRAGALGSDPIEFHGSLADQLGASAEDVGGVAFTHLHADHTGGLAAVCAALGHELDVFQTPWQADRGNYTTSPGRADIDDAGCVRMRRLEGGPLYGIPGFPGLVAVAGGGHTPGSTLFFARVGGSTWVLAGDVSNVQQALLSNHPKERIYSLLVTPEGPARLEELRRWLALLDAETDTHVLVSHDTDFIASSGMPPYAPPSGGASPKD
jgi:glyoxylase-like metal-dependent hydrolase (beta-lactamase superfamily II)